MVSRSRCPNVVSSSSYSVVVLVDLLFDPFGGRWGDLEEGALAAEQAVAKLRQVWSGTVGGVAGFLRPEPAPPIIIGGFGPKMAELAGRVGDGINLPGGPGLSQLVAIALEACERS